MTQVITPQQGTINQYVADGVTTTYTYSFLILQANSANSDIAVYVTPPNQAANPVADLVPYTSYTVTGVGVTAGGTVIFNTAPAIGSIITLSRNMQVSITTQFNDAQTFNGQSLDNAFQRIILILQQMQGTFTINAGSTGSISRALQYVVDTYLPTQVNNILPLLTNIDNQVWISQGGQIVAAVIEENPSSSTLRGQLASQTAGGDGTSLVGYFDQNSQTGETLAKYLNTSNIYGVDTGAVNALTFNVALTSAFSAYQKGMIVRVLVNHTNTAAATLAISSAGTVNIKRTASIALQPGDLVAGQIAEMQYDGTQMLLIDVAQPYYGVDTSVAANTITVNLNPALAIYNAGYPVMLVKIANTNTGATTIAINGLTAKAVVLPNGGALIGNELYVGMIAEFVYDGANIQLLNPARVFATSAQVLAGTVANLPVTPAGLASGYNVGGGYIQLPGGLIIQWGFTSPITVSGNANFTFPIPFPNAFFGYAVTSQLTNPAQYAIASVNEGASNNTKLNVINTAGSTNTSSFRVVVMGY